MQTIIPNERIATLLTHKCPEPSRAFAKDAHKYHQYPICGFISYYMDLEKLKFVQSLVEPKQFVDGIFAKDIWNDNAIMTAIEANKGSTIQYLLSIEGVKQRYDQDISELCRIIMKLNKYWNDEIGKIIVNELKLTETKLNQAKQSNKDVDVSKLLSICKL